MDKKQRDILHVHKNFLKQNIIWTPELAKKLQTEGLVTESVLRGIENSRSQDEKVSKILEFVIMRGPEGYRKFTDILHTTGHVFLADFLREEDIIKKKLNTDELYKTLPFLARLKEDERNALDTFFVDKLRNESLKHVWKHDFREKEKAIHARYQQIEMADEIKDQTKKWKDMKKAYEDQITAQKEEIEVLNLQIKGLNHAVRETENRLRGDFEKQIRFNAANENQIKRAQEKVVASEWILREINAKMAPYLKKKARILTDKERKDLEHYAFSFMIPDFEVFCEQYNELLQIRRMFNTLREDKEYVLTYMIGHTPNNLDEISLKDEFKKYLFKNDEAITNLKDKLADAEVIIEGQKSQVDKMMQDSSEKKKWAMGANVWQGAIMNVMRNQLQDLKRDIRMKESRIQICESDAAKLRSINAELRQEVARARAEKQSVSSHETVKRISIDMNGRVSVNSDNSINSAALETSLDNYSDVKADSKSKNSILPPMSSKVIKAASTENYKKPKPFNNVVVSQAETGRYPSSFAQPGLMTAPVKFEKRPQGHDKYSQMPFGFGEIQKMHVQGKSKFEKSLQPPKIRN